MKAPTPREKIGVLAVGTIFGETSAAAGLAREIFSKHPVQNVTYRTLDVYEGQKFNAPFFIKMIWPQLPLFLWAFKLLGLNPRFLLDKLAARFNQDVVMMHLGAEIRRLWQSGCDRVYIVSVSFGGVFALKHAVEMPGDISGIVAYFPHWKTPSGHPIESVELHWLAVPTLLLYGQDSGAALEPGTIEEAEGRARMNINLRVEVIADGKFAFAGEFIQGGIINPLRDLEAERLSVKIAEGFIGLGPGIEEFVPAQAAD